MPDRTGVQPSVELAAFYRHAAASIAEGFCPACRAPLAPVAHDDTVTIGTRCSTCQQWWSIGADAGRTISRTSGYRPDRELGTVLLVPDWAI